jgi:hypothetical protein
VRTPNTDDAVEHRIAGLCIRCPDVVTGLQHMTFEKELLVCDFLHRLPGSCRGQHML